MIIDNYPYTNFHELNMDWILSKVKELAEKWAGVESQFNSLREFVENFFSSPEFEQAVTNEIMQLFDSGAFDNIFQGTYVTAETIQKTINEYASARKKLRILKSHITLNETLNIPDNADIDFQNTTLSRPSGKIFDMVNVPGNNVRIEQLTINGEAVRDNLNNATAAHRFGGIHIFGNNFFAEKLTVNETVNNELTFAIFVDNCTNCQMFHVECYNNRGSAIGYNNGYNHLLSFARGENNLGSLITGSGYDTLMISDVYAKDNSYSAVSINGSNCLLNNIIALNSGFSGLNIGHAGVLTHASHVIVNGLTSYNNTYEGLTMTNASDVVVNGAYLLDNVRTGIRLDTCENINLDNIHVNGESLGLNSMNKNSVSISNSTLNSANFTENEYKLNSVDIASTLTLASGCTGYASNVRVQTGITIASGSHTFYNVTTPTITRYSSPKIIVDGEYTNNLTLNSDCYGYCTQIIRGSTSTLFGHITTNTSPSTTALTLEKGIPTVQIGSGEGVVVNTDGSVVINTGEHYFSITYSTAENLNI